MSAYTPAQWARLTAPDLDVSPAIEDRPRVVGVRCHRGTGKPMPVIRYSDGRVRWILPSGRLAAR